MTKWRNKVEIKQHFTRDNSDESVLRVCELLIPQLKYIVKKEERKIEKHSKFALDEYDVEEFKNLVEEFEWIRDSIKKEENPEQYSYTDWTEAFNGYLDALYDMGNLETKAKDSFTDKEKFLWVG